MPVLVLFSPHSSLFVASCSQNQLHLRLNGRIMQILVVMLKVIAFAFGLESIVIPECLAELV